MSLLVAFSFSLANSLISADVLSAARERYTNTFSKAGLVKRPCRKVSFNISCNRNRLETENIFLREESIVKKKPKTTIKKSGSVT